MRRWYVIDLSRGISQLPVSDVAVVFDARDRCGRIGETLDANVRKEPIVSLIYDPLGRSNGRRIVRYEARPSETQEGVYQKLAFRRDNISIQDIAALDLTESDQRGAEELGVGFKEFQELVSKVKKAQAIISSRAKEFEQFSIPPTWAWDYQYTRELAFVMSFAGGILIALSVKLAHLISKRIWNAEAAPIAEIGVGLTLWIALCLFNRGEMLIRAIPLIFLVGPVFVLQVARLTILSRFPLFSFCNEVERIGMVLRERESTTPDSRGAGK
jgi:hypothetical protein